MRGGGAMGRQHGEMELFVAANQTYMCACATTGLPLLPAVCIMACASA